MVSHPGMESTNRLKHHLSLRDVMAKNPSKDVIIESSGF